jgi:hypothetical protein
MNGLLYLNVSEISIGNLAKGAGKEREGKNSAIGESSWES